MIEIVRDHSAVSVRDHIALIVRDHTVVSGRHVKFWRSLCGSQIGNVKNRDYNKLDIEVLIGKKFLLL